MPHQLNCIDTHLGGRHGASNALRRHPLANRHDTVEILGHLRYIVESGHGGQLLQLGLVGILKVRGNHGLGRFILQAFGKGLEDGFGHSGRISIAGSTSTSQDTRQQVTASTSTTTAIIATKEKGRRIKVGKR